jgi:hypothetical protein
MISQEGVILPRHQPDVVLGGSLVRLPDGYLGIPSYSGGGSNPLTVQQVYANARQRRYAKNWDGKNLDATLVTRFTDPFRIVLACCNVGIGSFAAYQAGDGAEYGVIRDEAKHRHPIGNFPSNQFANQPNDAFDAKRPTFRLTGEVGGSSTRSYAVFQCRDCGRIYNPRNLAKLGRLLFDERPTSYLVRPP